VHDVAEAGGLDARRRQDVKAFARTIDDQESIL
jgi:hypothetical protein